MSCRDDDRPDGGEVLLRSELPDIRHAAEVILRGHEYATAAGWPYDRYSEDLVKALATRILSMVDALERRDPLAAPGSRPDKMHRGAQALVRLLSDGRRHEISQMQETVGRALGQDGRPQVRAYIAHANLYLLGAKRRIVSAAGGRQYMLRDHVALRGGDEEE